jgi:DNA-binding IclR family transcriptional regulator
MNTVDNVARVLRLFTPERGVLSVTEVAQQLGLPKSSTSRLLKAMAEAGLLASADGTTGYAVGNLIFETSRRHRVNSTLSLAADDALTRIVKATGHTGYVAMLDGTVVLGLRMRRCWQGSTMRRSAGGTPHRSNHPPPTRPRQWMSCWQPLPLSATRAGRWRRTRACPE